MSLFEWLAEQDLGIGRWEQYQDDHNLPLYHLEEVTRGEVDDLERRFLAHLDEQAIRRAEQVITDVMGPLEC